MPSSLLMSAEANAVGMMEVGGEAVVLVLPAGVEVEVEATAAGVALPPPEFSLVMALSAAATSLSSAKLVVVDVFVGVVGGDVVHRRTQVLNAYRRVNSSNVKGDSRRTERCVG